MIETLPDTLALLSTVRVPHGQGPVVVQSVDALGPLAADGPGTSGLMDWIKANALPLIVLACACVAGVGALRQNASKVITIGALIIVVLLIAGIAGSAATQQTISQWALGLFGL